MIDYKSIDTILDYIDYIGQGVLPAYNPESDLLYVKTIAILSWYGFTADEMAQLKTSNLIIEAGKYYGIKLQDHQVQIGWRACKLLCCIGVQYLYRTFPSGKSQVIRGLTGYLLRSDMFMEAPTPNAILNRWSRFNAALKKLKYDEISLKQIKEKTNGN